MSIEEFTKAVEKDVGRQLTEDEAIQCAHLYWTNAGVRLAAKTLLSADSRLTPHQGA